MRVTVESNLSIKNMFEPPLELHIEENACTLRDLLKKLDKMCPLLEFFRDGMPGENVNGLLVNGKPHRLLPCGLSSELTDGDKVKLEVTLEPLWGG